MTPNDIARLHARIYGAVQGVFFRDSTRQVAERLGVTGWVRNVPDGSVEVVAEGPRPALESLLNYLRVGPVQARVERVDARWQPPADQFTAFDIRF